MLKQLFAHEVRLARIKLLHNRSEGGAKAAKADGKQAEAEEGASALSGNNRVGAVPPHVQAQLEKALGGKTGSSSLLAQASESILLDPTRLRAALVRIAEAAAAASSSAAGHKQAMDAANAAATADGTAVESGASRFLQVAAAKSRKAELARKRSAITSTGSSMPLSAEPETPSLGPTDVDMAGDRDMTEAPATHLTRMMRYPIVLRYQEGFTNAIRRPIYAADFL